MTRIDEYVDALPPWQQATVRELLDCVSDALPQADLSIKWSQPVFTTNGPCVFIKPARAHVNLGFWWGAKLANPDGILEGSGDKMRHIKLREGDRIDRSRVQQLAREADRLNHELGNPTTTRA